MTRFLAALLCLTLISGCATLFDHAPTLPEEEETDCEWDTSRGIAVVTKLTENRYHFSFHPGGVEIIKQETELESRPAVGDEFKALLRTPASGPCQDPKLELVEPVGGN